MHLMVIIILAVANNSFQLFIRETSNFSLPLFFNGNLFGPIDSSSYWLLLYLYFYFKAYRSLAKIICYKIAFFKNSINSEKRSTLKRRSTWEKFLIFLFSSPNYVENAQKIMCCSIWLRLRCDSEYCDPQSFLILNGLFICSSCIFIQEHYFISTLTNLYSVLTFILSLLFVYSPLKRSTEKVYVIK